MRSAMKRWEFLGTGDFNQLLLKSIAITTSSTKSILYVHLPKPFICLLISYLLYSSDTFRLFCRNIALITFPQ